MYELIIYANFLLYIIEKEKSFHALKQIYIFFVSLVEIMAYGTLGKGTGRHQGDNFKTVNTATARFEILCQLC